ncbi:MAG: PAS-domain containing protein [Rhodospirillaceae bacterium]
MSVSADQTTDAKLTVLVIEPEPEALRFITSVLCSKYRVVTAEDRSQGLTSARLDLPCLILTAVTMPLMSVPVILMANAEDVAQPDAEACLADEYLVKPFGFLELLTRVATLIRLHDLEARLAESKARLGLIMDNVPAGIVLLKPIEGEHPDYLITAVNKNVNRVAGFTQDFLYEGGHLAQCLRPAAASGMYGECEIDRRIAERMQWYASRPDETIQSVFPTINGRFVQASRSPHGTFGFVVVTVDITERILAEQALTVKSGQFDLMLENIPEGVFMCARI